MRWTPGQIEAATGGRSRPGDEPVPAVLSPVVTDSRVASPGCLFVALRAERDGHAFIPAALAAGAAGYLCQAGWDRGAGGSGWACEVADPAVALLDLGRAARRHLPDRVVGITGSVGKTSAKDLTAAALGARWRVAASERSFNNEIGVPLTLANAPDDTEITVVEMGARGPGHITLLCSVAAPTVAVVTAVAAVHTERFGNLDGVARAKRELVEALPPSGTAVLNVDDRAVAAMAVATAARVLRYGLGPGADVTATDVRLDADLRPTFVLRSPWGSTEVQLSVRGEHHVGNALAAAAVALHHDVDLAGVVAGLGAARLSPWRMELRRTAGGAVVLNDAYNANPVSVAAALRSLAALDARRRVAVLAEMAELGPIAPNEHRGVAELARALGIEVVAVGTPLYGCPPVAGPREAAAAVGPLGDGDAVLVKGSRVAGLEVLADLLAPPDGVRP